MEDFEEVKGKRGLEEDKLAEALRNTNLIQIVQDYTGADTGVCVDTIKATKNGNTTVVDAINAFIAKVLAE